MLGTIVLMTVTALLLLRPGPVRRQTPPDPASARSTVFEYLRALEAEDRGWLASLVPEGFDAKSDIDDRLRRLAGVRTAGADVQLVSDLSPGLLSVTIRTLGRDGGALVWSESMVPHDRGWRLVLGRASLRPSGLSAPSDIRRP